LESLQRSFEIASSLTSEIVKKGYVVINAGGDHHLPAMRPLTDLIELGGSPKCRAERFHPEDRCLGCERFFLPDLQQLFARRKYKLSQNSIPLRALSLISYAMK